MEADKRKKKEKKDDDSIPTRHVPAHMRIIPEFLGKVDDTQYGVEGRLSKILLYMRAYPEPKVLWYKGAEKLEMGDKYQCTVTSTGEMCLEISDFSWSDIGEYKVYLENQYGSATQIINMDMADPPTFLDPLKDQVFNLRKDSKLECRVNGVPYPTITFKKDWRMIADSHRIKIAREDYDHWTMNIRNAIHMDEGIYQCMAENVAGKVHCTANVKVSDKIGMFRDIKFNQVPIEEYFHVIDELGRGSCGVVRRVIDKNSGNQYAAKFLRFPDFTTKEALQSELEIMSLLDHMHIAQVQDGYEDKKRLSIVMEMYPITCEAA